MKKLIYISPEAQVEDLNGEDVLLVSVVANNEENAKELPEISYDDVEW